MHGPTPTSEAREVDVTGSHLLMQTTFRDTPRGIGPSRTSPSVSATVGGRTQYNYPNANYSPMIGLRWEYSPMVGIKIAAVLGGFFLLYAIYNTLKGVVKCWKQSTDDEEEDTSDEEEDGKQSEELEVVESTRLDWELVSPKRVVDDGVRPELQRPLPYPLSQYLGRLQCTVEIPDCEEDGNCERTDSRTCA